MHKSDSTNAQRSQPNAILSPAELADEVGRKAKKAALKACKAGLLGTHWRIEVFRAGGKIRTKVEGEDADD